mgnify:CR=1 FL=1
MKHLWVKAGQLINRYHLFTIDDDALREDTMTRNFDRVRIAALLGSILTFIHVIIFAVKIYDPTQSYNRIWLKGIFWTHSLFFVCFGLILFLTTKPFKARFKSAKAKQMIVVFAYISVMLLSNILTVFDQLITSAINPYILGTIAVSIIVLVPSFQALFAQFANGLLFILLSPLTQDDKAVLLSNNVNTITTVFISAFIANNFWHEYVKRFAQKKVIQQHQTDLEAAYSKLKLQANQLEEAVKQRNKVFSLISHDLRAPFNALIGSSELLLNENLGLSKDEQLTLKTNILNTAQTTYFLLENLLGWSQMQQDRIKINPLPLFVKDIVLSAISDCKHTAAAKNIKLVTDAEDGLVIVGDLFMLQTVLRNLIMNAVKFSYKNGIVRVLAHKQGQSHISISVIDNGVGMDEAQIANLFTNDIVSTTGTAGDKGLGLGLQLSHEFVKMQNGSIEVFSVAGDGSRFEIIMPINSAFSDIDNPKQLA